MRALQADAKDNVAVVVQDVAAGDEVTVTEILRVKVCEDIPVGHKIAIDRKSTRLNSSHS